MDRKRREPVRRRMGLRQRMGLRRRTNRKFAGLLLFSNFGSRNGTTTAFRQKDGSILIRCGCFSGSLKDFVEKVEKTHGANQYGLEYMAIANVIKVRFGIA